MVFGAHNNSMKRSDFIKNVRNTAQSLESSTPYLLFDWLRFLSHHPINGDLTKAAGLWTALFESELTCCTCVYLCRQEAVKAQWGAVIPTPHWVHILPRSQQKHPEYGGGARWTAEAVRGISEDSLRHLGRGAHGAYPSERYWKQMEWRGCEGLAHWGDGGPAKGGTLKRSSNIWLFCCWPEVCHVPRKRSSEEALSECDCQRWCGSEGKQKPHRISTLVCAALLTQPSSAVRSRQSTAGKPFGRHK